MVPKSNVAPRFIVMGTFYSIYQLRIKSSTYYKRINDRRNAFFHEVLTKSFLQKKSCSLTDESSINHTRCESYILI